MPDTHIIITITRIAWIDPVSKPGVRYQRELYVWVAVVFG